MISRSTFLKVVARALRDGEWHGAAMLERLERLVGVARRPWMIDIVVHAGATFIDTPDEQTLIAWLDELGRLQAPPARPTREALAALFERLKVIGRQSDNRAALKALDGDAARGEEELDDEGDDDLDDDDRDGVIGNALREGVRIRQWPLTLPEMSDSPWHVPALATHGELATWLGLDAARLMILADRRQISRHASDPRARHYRYRWVAKRSGGVRLIEAPKPTLRRVQRELLDGIVSRIPAHDACHGFVAGRSVRSFAEPHVGHDVVVRMDLRSFFTSVFAPRVRAILRAAGYPEDVTRTLAALCSHATPLDEIRAQTIDPVDRARLRTPHLPQGAPTSGALANLAAFGLDVRITAFAKSIGATYTRYADDLALSGPRELVRDAAWIVGTVAAIAQDEGFVLNFRKTRVMTQSDRQRVAGIVVNDKLAIARDDVDQLRAILHNCVRTGPAAQNRDNHPDFRAHLLGRISWVASVAPAKRARLMAMFERIAWA